MARLDDGQIVFREAQLKNKPTNEITIAFWLRADSNSDKQALFTVQGAAVAKDIYQLEIRNGKLAWFHVDAEGV